MTNELIGRPTSFGKRVSYPLGRIDIQFREVNSDGSQSNEDRTLKLLMGSDEARQLADNLHLFAREMDASGGTRQ